MAEKRVSVRLVAEGGRQVRAELEGVGEAGAQGFGRLSREMDMANARMAGFARRVRVAAAAATVALAAAGAAMIRSGLQTVDAQAKLAASLDTTVASIQVLERAGDLAGG
jgi:1-aminocyclopropane-1-carboxylate deaminase/D-cysteine desulfhydrase-like pyridoxal-dependent ACC family enzyme